MTNAVTGIPKFDAQDYVTGTAEDFNKELNKTKSKWLKEPGLYDLRVAAIKCRGVAKGDQHWCSFQFTLKSTNDEQMNHFIMLPLKRVNNFQYGTKKTYFVYKSLCDFLKGFGITLEFETAMGTIGGLLNNMEVLIDKTFKAQVGYEGSYVRYLGKNGENNEYEIVVKGEGLKDDEDKVLIFSDWKAAENYARGIKLTLSGFPEILSIVPGATSVIAAEEGSIADEEIPF